MSGFALGAMLSAHAVHAAPAALATATTALSLQSAAATMTSPAAHLAAQKGAVTLMSLIKSKVTVGLMLLAVGGTTAALAFRALAAPGGVAPAAALPLAAAPQAAPGAGPPGVPAGGRNAGAPPAKGDDSWRKRFDEVYRLDQAQALRHIPPPIILERTAYVRSLGTFVDPTEDGLFVFAWRDGHAEFDNWSLGVPTISKVLGTLVGLPSSKLEMKLKDRAKAKEENRDLSRRGWRTVVADDPNLNGIDFHAP